MQTSWYTEIFVWRYKFLFWKTRRLSLPKAADACLILFWTSLSMLLSSERILPRYLNDVLQTDAYQWCWRWVEWMGCWYSTDRLPLFWWCWWSAPSCCKPSQLHPGQPGGLVECEPQERSHLHTAAQGPSLCAAWWLLAASWCWRGCHLACRLLSSRCCPQFP